MKPLYIAFDPGLTTGYVLAGASDYRLFELLDVEDIAWGSLLPFVTSQLLSYDPQVIIIEDFRLYAHAAQHLIYNDFPAVQVIGQIKALAYTHRPDTPVVMQMPGVRKSVKILDQHTEMLKGTHHAKDAYRHLRYYLVKNRIDHTS